ncbi:MAG TPA: hypothetical protein VEV63_16605 [Streptosporangiaceae bacterium]|nr:hypothetical protein [Streptosporangiaceae bacterium]
MDLTWRDAVSSLTIAIMLVVYVAYLTGAFWLISSTWAAAGVILIVGIGGRVISHDAKAAASAELLHKTARLAAAAFGVIALLAGLAALLLSSGYSLKIFIMSSIVAWLAGVISHI